MMQIVIKIDEKYYKFIKELVENFDYNYTPWNLIANGTPLPKGHGRLKDIDRLESHDEYDGQGFTKSVYKDDIDSAQTIIEADKGE